MRQRLENFLYSGRWSFRRDFQESYIRKLGGLAPEMGAQLSPWPAETALVLHPRHIHVKPRYFFTQLCKSRVNRFCLMQDYPLKNLKGLSAMPKRSRVSVTSSSDGDGDERESFNWPPFLQLDKPLEPLKDVGILHSRPPVISIPAHKAGPGKAKDTGARRFSCMRGMPGNYF